MGQARTKLKRSMGAQEELITSGTVGTMLNVPTHEAPLQMTTKARHKASQTEAQVIAVMPSIEYPDPLVLIAQVLDIFLNVPTLYDKADASVVTMDMALQDLSHAVELLDLPKKEAHRVMHEIKTNRVERRKAKDFGMKAKPLYDFIKNKPELTASLLNLQKELIRVNDALGRRTYTPRVRQDLQELFTAKRGVAITITSEGDL